MNEKETIQFVQNEAREALDNSMGYTERGDPGTVIRMLRNALMNIYVACRPPGDSPEAGS